MKKIKIKIHETGYISPLKTFGPIYSPIKVSEDLYKELVAKRIKLEVLKEKLPTVKKEVIEKQPASLRAKVSLPIEEEKEETIEVKEEQPEVLTIEEKEEVVEEVKKTEVVSETKMTVKKKGRKK